MGCEHSSCSEQNSLIFNHRGKHPLVMEQLSIPDRLKSIQILKRNDSFLTEQLLMHISPLQNLLDADYNYTALHVASQFNSFISLEQILLWIRRNLNESYTIAVNIQDLTGLSPAMVCAAHNSPESLYILLNEGAVDITLRDRNDSDIMELCKDNSYDCLVMVTNFKSPEKLNTLANPAFFTSKGYLSAGSLKKANSRIDDYPLMTAPEILKKVQNDIKRTQVSRNKKLADSFKFSVGSQVQQIQNPDLACLGELPKDSLTFRILQEVIKTGKNFEDKNFPRDLKRITGNNVLHPQYGSFQNAKWIRPEEIFGCKLEQLKLFAKIDPTDVIEGILGATTLLAAISAMAEYPSRITKLFMNMTANKWGVYGVKLCIQGQISEIVIDDYFPCIQAQQSGHLTPIFTAPKGKELWVLILEKAWAKAYGNYGTSESGLIDEAIEDLSGEPAFRYEIDKLKENEAWKILENADNAKWVICATALSIKKSVGDMSGPKSGLQPSQVYTVLSLHEIGTQRLIKLRNPLRNALWTGDYSEKSPLYTPEVKKVVGYNESKEGMFVMCLKDFMLNFSDIGIGSHHEGWNMLSLMAENPPKQSKFFKLSVTEDTFVYLRVHFRDKKKFGELEQEFMPYPFVDFMIAKDLGNGTYSNVVSNPDDVDTVGESGKRTVYIAKSHKIRLTIGQYIIRVKAIWDDLPRKPFTLSCYSEAKVDIQPLQNVPNFMQKTLITESRKYPNIEQRKLGVFGYGYCGNLIYLFAENKDPIKKWTIYVKFTTLVNLKLGKPFRKSENEFQITVGPATTEIAYLKKIDHSEHCDFHWAMEDQWAAPSTGAVPKK